MKAYAVKRLALSVCIAALLSGALAACVPLVVGGAVAGGSLVAIDRRTSGAQLDDEAIELRAGSRIRSELGTRVRASVTSYNRSAQFEGQAAGGAGGFDGGQRCVGCQRTRRFEQPIAG